MTYLHDATGGETLGISEFYIPEHRTRYNETRHRPILVYFFVDDTKSTPREQEEQSRSAVEEGLNRIKSHLDTIGAKISNIFILQSDYIHHPPPN
ncbi:hypothetical protein V6Z11_D13G156800 [Gossypium hirsutum]